MKKPPTKRPYIARLIVYNIETVKISTRRAVTRWLRRLADDLEKDMWYRDRLKYAAKFTATYDRRAKP